MRGIRSFFLVVAFLVSPLSQAEIIRFMDIDQGRVFRGSMPESLTDVENLKALGIKTIVTFQTWGPTVDNELELGRRVGIHIMSYPFNAVWPDTKMLEAAFVAITNPANHPVFFHCRQGKDRTGTVAALYRTRIQHWKVDDAYAEMERMGYNPIYFLLKSYLYSNYDRPRSLEPLPWYPEWAVP